MATKITNTAPIRVKPSVLTKVKKLTAMVRRDGWQAALGVDRANAPTLGSVVEVAIDHQLILLAARAKNR